MYAARVGCRPLVSVSADGSSRLFVDECEKKLLITIKHVPRCHRREGKESTRVAHTGPGMHALHAHQEQMNNQGRKHSCTCMRIDGDQTPRSMVFRLCHVNTNRTSVGQGQTPGTVTSPMQPRRHGRWRDQKGSDSKIFQKQGQFMLKFAI